MQENDYIFMTMDDNNKSGNKNSDNNDKSSIRVDETEELPCLKKNESQIQTDLKIKIIRS